MLSIAASIARPTAKPTLPTKQIPTTVKPPISQGAKRMFSTKDLGSWDIAMLLSLLIAAIAAVAVVFTTFQALKSQKAETAKAELALDEYKARASVETAQAHAVASQASENAGAANERASVADQKAAEANLKAETERGERLKLEAKYAPRIVTEGQVRTLEQTLAPLKGQSIDVISYETLGTDVAEYAFVLTANLNHAGLHATQFTPFSGSGLVWGVLVQTEHGYSQDQAATLAAAFEAAGIHVRLMDPYPVGQPIAGGFMGPTGVTPTAKLRLLVGAKPQPNVPDASAERTPAK